MALPKPELISRDPQTIIDEMIADYQNRTGKTLEPAQIETLLINAFAFRETLLRNQVQETALQCLVEYAYFPMIDHLGQLVGVTRLPAQSAKTTILLTLTEGHTDVVIPSGLRVQSTDGRATFELIESATVLTGTNTVSIIAIAQQSGVLFNDYAIDTITEILDPQPYLASASNTTVSEGGTDEETDDALRERIKLAPNSFSTAGPYKAYEFWTKSASPLIIDVAVDNRKYQSGDTIPSGYAIGDAIPGTVEIFPLMADLAETPTEILDAVETVLTAEKIRPLNDIIFVTSPNGVDTDIVVNLVIYEGVIQADIISAVTANLENFKNGRRKLLGQDIVIDQIKSVSMIEGVYKCNVATPATDLIINSTEFADIGTITVNVTGTNVG
jgi:phage-related baseplate assembly protein